MRKLVVCALVLIAIGGCGKKDSEPAPAYTSLDGIWTYATPDMAIVVDFELKTSISGTVQVLNPTIKVDGTQGAAVGTLTNVDLPLIEQLRINANDAALVNNYSITFSDCTVSSTFSIISVADATYTYPWGQFKSLTNIVITRK